MALRDLEAIWLYVAQDNPAAADQLLRSIAFAARQLELFPEGRPLRPEIGSGARLLPVGRYVVLYRVLPEIVDLAGLMP